jgi:glycosyltransferase involved in cell wall biosynthesis
VQSILDRLAETREFDVAVVEDSAMSPYELPPGAATVLTEHEVLQPRPVDWRAGGPRRWPSWAFGELDWRKRPRFQRRAWRRFDRVLAFSRRDAEAIGELAPEIAGRVRVSPFGLVLPPPADPARERQDTLLFSGNFTHQPNRDAAAWLAGEILPALLELRPGARLLLLGSSPPPSVKALAGPAIEVVADPPSVEPALEAAAVVIAPVRTGGGMRMKVLQALAAGKAVVTTPRGREGFDCFETPPPLVVADGAGELAAATADLLADTDRRRELGRRARALAERHYSPPAWAPRLEAVYEEALREREAGGRG